MGSVTVDRIVCALAATLGGFLGAYASTTGFLSLLDRLNRRTT